MSRVLQVLAGGLVVSCQAPPGHPLRTVETVVKLAACAWLGGAAGVRINSAEDVAAVRAALPGMPIIGLHKVPAPHRDLITPRRDLAAGLAAAGADIIALEGSGEAPLAEMIAWIKGELGLPVMADVATASDGIEAWQSGADLVASTLSGYTTDTVFRPGPDFDLVRQLTSAGVRTTAEGRISTDSHVRQAFALGAHSVVVGTAITDPITITHRLAAVTPAGAASRTS